MTVIYTVTSDWFQDSDNGTASFPTKAAAMKEARQIDDVPWTVTKITLAKLPARELACALVNGRGFAAKQEKLAEGNW